MPLKSKYVTYIYFFLLIFANNLLVAQATPNPCSFSKIKCGEGQKNTLYNSFFSETVVYSPPGTSMPIWFAFGDSLTSIIDTTGSYNFT